MIRSLTLALAAVAALANPPWVAAQYGGYPPPPPGYAPPYAYPPPGPNIQPDLGGVWFMAGRQDAPCRVIPSRGGDRALFINENGDRAEAFIRGNRISVPRWNLDGYFDGNDIRWANRSVWTR